MALQNFIAKVWVAGIMKALQKVHVFASVANSSYSGVVHNMYDKVEILMIGDITAKPYVKDTNIADPEDVGDAATVLIVDQAHYFNFKVNDVEAVQRKREVLDAATLKGAYSFRNAVDQYFAGLYPQAGIQFYATGTTPHAVNSLNVDDVLLELGEKMSKANIPKENRFAVIPPWLETKLVLAGLLVKTSNDALYANSMIGRVHNFDILVSNNVSMLDPVAETDSRIIAGIRNESLSFAGAIHSIEAYRPEKRFEDAVKGLYVYGGKVMRPDETACAHLSKAAEV